MENKEISKVLKLLSQLMELHEENPFKIRSIANASFKVDKLPYKLKDKSLAELETIDGVGKSTASKIWELLQNGNIEELNNLAALTPAGVLDMLGIKGVGPKKIAIIWKTLGIENIGELYYACNENRLIEAKGFGLKTQEDIKKAIEFKMASKGRFLYASIESVAYSYLNSLKKIADKVDPTCLIEITGEFRRKCEIIDKLEFLIAGTDILQIKNVIEGSLSGELNTTENSISLKDENGINIQIHFCNKEKFAYTLFETTGAEKHVQEVLQLLTNKDFDSESTLYQSAGLDFIEPELREGDKEIGWSKNHELPNLITFADLKGTLHNHSTWSDGVHTLEEMALYCKDELKLEYLGICDHSKTAVYANGLSIERVLQQQAEIDLLNEKLAPFRIFKGIESDILSEGSLDYPNEILEKFDFVVASVHSNLKMDEEKATDRIIKAIENPYTTILGHPTGRLLLSRGGYPIDYKKIIDACAANNVVIEINANPLRLDLDWRWHQYALERGVLLSINPDAHRNEGFSDMHYGVYVARKGALTKEKCLNAFDLNHISSFFQAQKRKR
ncbi:PHP domain protein [Pseudopedobacter saltans DSM 12145]|uniref:PHP domain protein n=1 Tax=Pseudopedobacter saltans (strain ATCC 51119 / DSM 12145 / JCM 21818 / CCUG 39354 / LMG 10337 / NBRC 100064 / NCIMB 13643) TaxID=762903 RepID=F0SB22_PSESL|nr:DNA polymerase/3'-5' exonuclease PolX [Pseudopedobacter saltans]ADY52657.1 PHP domain protein [Pseudopedobacter saltans DSM 12145]